ncbi:hypothetical protein AB0200_13005 [Klebsiella pneumoniae]|uniref:hypothetical protein n=1 Tax=Klebsiella pneumoniae TaxID=573 RepID=UPI00348E167C|nr:hypothetical protein [Klebsiella pneumoniae]
MSDSTPQNICTLFSELWRRLKLVFSNHYFLGFFILIVVIIGSISIWFTAVFNNSPGRLDRLIVNMNTLNFLAFSAPLLATTIFEKAVNIIINRNEVDATNIAVLLWLLFGTVFTISAIIVLYSIGSGNGSYFSWCSLFAWIISLMYWAVANIENPSYSMNVDSKSASGGAEVGSASSLNR